MTETRTGGCQCGAVRFRAATLKDNPHVCHCRMCQKATGNFFAALVGVPKEDLTWTRGQPAEFRSSESGARGFCRDCGTPLYYSGTGNAHLSLSIAAFDDPGAIPLRFEAGYESRLPQLDQLGGLERYRTADWGDLEQVSLRTSCQHPDHDTDVWPDHS